MANHNNMPPAPAPAAPAGPPGGSMQAGQPTFEEALARLEGIAARLEAGQVPLEEALALFEEGVRLSKSATQRLDQAEHRLEVLLQDGTTAPLASHGDEGGTQ